MIRNDAEAAVINKKSRPVGLYGVWVCDELLGLKYASSLLDPYVVYKSRAGDVR